MLRGLPAQNGKKSKDDQPGEIGVAVPDFRPKPFNAGHGNGRGGEIGDDHPLDAVGVGVQGGHHLGQHDVDDGGVKQGDKNPYHDNAGGQPLVHDWFVRGGVHGMRLAVSVQFNVDGYRIAGL